MPQHILVYGSLRRGHFNNVLLQEVADFVGEVRLPGYDLYRVGWYPGIKPNETNRDGVLCELYALHPDKTLRHLDAYEGYVDEDPDASLFLRQKVQINDGPEAYVYTYNREVSPEQQVKDGIWPT